MDLREWVVKNVDSVDMPGFACMMLQPQQSPEIDGTRTVWKVWRPRIEAPFSAVSGSSSAIPAATLRQAFLINGPQPIRKGQVGVAYSGFQLRALVKKSAPATANIVGPINMQWYLDSGGWGFQNLGSDPHAVIGTSDPVRYVSPISTHPNAFACIYTQGDAIQPSTSADCDVQKIVSETLVTQSWRVNVFNTATRAVDSNKPLQCKLEYATLRYLIDVEECN